MNEILVAITFPIFFAILAWGFGYWAMKGAIRAFAEKPIDISYRILQKGIRDDEL